MSLGEPHLTVREPIRILFAHLARSNVTTPRCVHWDRQNGGWSGEKCALEATNATHSTCACSTMGTLALLETVAVDDAMDRVTLMLTLVVTVTVAIISAISLALLVFYCKRVKVNTEYIFL